MSTEIIRDKHTNAILINNKHALTAYKAKKNQNNTIKILQKEINILKEDIIEIRKIIEIANQ